MVRAALVAQGHACRVHLGFGTRGFVSELPGVGRFLPIDDIPWRKRLYALWIIALAPRMLWALLRGEVVWANTVHALPAVLPMLWFAPRRVVVHLHEIEFPGLFRALARWAARRGAHVLCVSQVHREALGLDATVLPNCVTVRSEAPAERPPVLLFVGAVSRMKGFDLFVEVARHLQGAGIRAVACVPGIPPGATSLAQAAQEAGVELHCDVRDPMRMYPGATLLLQCTDPALATETFSLVMVEALSCGVPVATAGMKVAAEILGDAWAFDEPTRDAQRIAAAVRALIADPARLSALREAALARRERYAFPEFRERVAALLRNAPGDPS
jgi:glycosyltransferase involved in cell wall biosynthesis